MIGMRVILAVGILFLFSLPANAQTTLYVNATTGNDSVSRANNSANTPWRSIGRAAWGSTNRGAPNPGEAAQAGDTVNIAGGTYSYDGSTINNRWGVVYNPANQGSQGNFITFVCVGDCTLTAPTADAPVIGASGRNYIKWFADISQGNSWVIRGCGRQSGCSQNTVNTPPDVGPVVCHNNTGCWVEGAVVDGGPGIDVVQNYNAFRLETCTNCVIRNNVASNFTRDQVAGDTNHNQSIFTLYGVQNSLIEHNVGTNAGAGVYFKDTGTMRPQFGNIVRFNKFDRVLETIAFSLENEDRNYVYQNVGTNGRVGLAVVFGGLSNDWVFNNTFYRMSLASISLNSNGSGGRFWNNICVECATGVYAVGGPMVGESVLDLEHNVYHSFANFYTGTDGNRNLSGFRNTYRDQEQAAPASVDANPAFVNAGAGDFRLCTGAGAPAASCGGTSPVLNIGVDLHDLDRDGSISDTIPAGAFINNNEVIGLTTAMPSAPSNFRVTRTP